MSNSIPYLRSMTAGWPGIACLFFFIVLQGQIYGNDSFTVENPSSVAADSVFEIKVTFDGDEEIKIYGNNFEFLGRSGVMIRKTLVGAKFSEKRIYAYRLKPESMEPITLIVEVGGQRQRVEIKVVDQGKAKPTPPSQFSPIPSWRQLSQSPEDPILIRNHLSKEKVLVNETITMETVIYSELAIDSYQILRRYKQSCYQLVPVEKFTARRKPETINGKRYLSSIIFKYILYSPKKGKCTLEKIPFQITVLQPGFFFNKKTIDVTSLPVTFEVDDYPQAGQPDNFQFHYGDYHLRLTLPTQLEKNTPVRFAINVSGAGNFLALNEPEIHLSPSLSITKDKVIDDFSPDGHTLAGSKTYHYYLTSHELGRIRDTSEIVFSYYSPTTQSYKTQRQKFPELTVVPYSGYKVTGDDFMNIPVKQGEIALYPLYTGEFADWNSSSVDTVEVMGWYHVLGILGSLIFWVGVRRPDLSRFGPKSEIKRFRKEIAQLKNSDHNPDWTGLKKLTIHWIGVVYGLNSVKGWDKEVGKLISSSGLSSQEIDILKKLQGKISRWEIYLYSSEVTSENHFDQEVVDVDILLTELLSIHRHSKTPSAKSPVVS